jgi:hypothetical protein
MARLWLSVTAANQRRLKGIATAKVLGIYKVCNPHIDTVAVRRLCDQGECPETGGITLR